ncbi:hypothetical protein [Haliangium sp.]|uniref:hypothetical protein n=1 Tax=Haliangium sp. TaxID=2663208 RepID=UPI003D0E2AAC
MLQIVKELADKKALADILPKLASYWRSHEENTAAPQSGSIPHVEVTVLREAASTNEHVATPSRDEPRVASANNALDQAYEALSELLAQRPLHNIDPELEQRIDEAWDRLEARHEAAYEELRRELDESVEIPPHEMLRLLEEARNDRPDS